MMSRFCAAPDAADIHKKSVFIFDLDGTLWLGGVVFEGVVEAIKEIRRLGKQPLFLTNNSSSSRAEYFRRLSQLQLCENPSEIVMSTDSVISYLASRGHTRPFILGTPAMKLMCAEAGIHHEEDPSHVSVVVIGFDTTSTAEKLTQAAQLIAKGIPYIVAHPDRFCPSTAGPIVDCGAYYACIKAATGKEAVAILGKPSPTMIEEVEKRVCAGRHEMVIVGDRLLTDIALGHRAKISSILVLTGESSIQEAESSLEPPTWIVPSVADLFPPPSTTIW
jgi:NagD protein